MNYETLIKHYKTQVRAASELGVTQAAISLWKKNGIPELRSYQIEKKLNGTQRQSFNSPD